MSSLHKQEDGQVVFQRLIITILLLLSMAAIDQAAAEEAAAVGPAFTLNDAEALVKLGGLIVTVIAGVFGLPIIIINYRKTRIEIKKLDLEYAALKQNMRAHAETNFSDDGVIQINIDNSPESNVQVLADPRFLAPLLLLIDFVLSWIILTLAGYMLSAFNFFGLPIHFIIFILAAALLLPIAKQVIQVRRMFMPLTSAEEQNAYLKQVRIAVYVSYAMVILLLIAAASIILFIHFSGSGTVTDVVSYIAWSLLSLGLVLALCGPFFKSRADRYVSALLKN